MEINPLARAQMEQHAEATYPLECCGFFYGREGDDRQVIHALPVDNRKEGDQRRRFEVSPLDYMKAEKYALENGLDLLGVYHSHPDHPALPSEHDRKQALPNFSYIILSVRKGKAKELRSWRLKEAESFFDEELYK